MLPATVRMRRREDFAATQRRGRRIGQRTLIVHVRTPAPMGADSVVPSDSAPAGPESHPTDERRVGFVVGRAVGNSVTRHRVQRQLRHIVRDRLEALPSGAHLVVRALPAAAGQPATELAADFDAAVRRIAEPARSGRTAAGRSGRRSSPLPR